MPLFSRLGHVQFSWFGAADPNFDGLVRTIEGLSGSAASEISRIGPPQSPVPLRRAAFVLNDAVFRVNSQPGRLDFNVAPADAVFLNTFTMGRLDEFLWLFEELGTVYDSAFRQAIHVRVLTENLPPEEVAKTFRSVVGIKSDLGGSSDLLFQINRRMKKGDIDINRVLKWQGEIAQTFRFEGAPSQAVEEVSYLSYICDVNTVPHSSGRSADEQRAIFAVLAEVTINVLGIENIGNFS